MRAVAMMSVLILAGVSLTGCDMPGSHQQQAAAVPPCNCVQTPATMTAPPSPTEHLRRFAYAPRHHYYRHRYYAETRPAHYRERYNTYNKRYDVDRSQQSVDAYGYVSSSRVTRSEYSQSEYSQSGYAEGGYGESEYASGGGRIVWVDGYGRGYFTNGPVTVAATMRGKRLAPWHGYGVDCPDDGEPH